MTRSPSLSAQARRGTPSKGSCRRGLSAAAAAATSLALIEAAAAVEAEGGEGAWKRVGRVISPPMWSLNDCARVFLFFVFFWGGERERSA